MAPDPIQHGRALALPCVLRLRTSPSLSGGLRCRRMSLSSGPRLSALGGFSAGTHPMALHELWAMRIKNNPGYVARSMHARVLPRRITLEPPSWACKTCDKRHIKCLQDVRAGGCKAVTVQRRSVDHSRSTATVPSDPTAQCHAVHGYDVARRQDQTSTHPLKTSFATPSQ
jgi:hypothetical protein